MAGASFGLGETKVRPGIYVRVTTSDVEETPIIGVIGAIIDSDWGPLATVTKVVSLEDVTNTFGRLGNTELLREAFRGGAKEAMVYREGTGGALATKTLVDTTGSPVDAVRIDAKYKGVRGNTFKLSIRNHLTDVTLRELLVYEGSDLRQTVSFVGGAAEAQNLVDAVTLSNSEWITATHLAAGNGVLATVTAVSMASGTDPTTSGATLTAGLTALETEDFEILVINSEDSADHTTVEAYVERVRSEGKLVKAVVGEPTSVSFATRKTNAAALNNWAVIYVGNGFKTGKGTVDDPYVNVEGQEAAARVAGMIVKTPITSSLTHAKVDKATDLYGGLINSEIAAAINAGMVVFSRNANKEVQIEYGITTYVTLDVDHDKGWKKIRRVRTRDSLIERITVKWDALVGTVNNDADGRAIFVMNGRGVMEDMVKEGALLSGILKEDPANVAAGDSAWFVGQVDDLDSAEHVYITMSFRFAPK